MSSKSVGETFNALTDAQQKLVLSGDLLTEQQKRIIVGNTNLSMSEAGVITNTEGVVLSENKATASTFSLSSAFKGLAASLGITTTALGVITGALATVAVGAIAYKKWAEYQEELRQSAYDTAIALDEQNKSVDGYVERYKELRTALQNAKGDEEATYAIKQDLLTLQNELNDAFGEEYGKLNLVTDAYKDQTEAIKEYNKELAQSYLNENDKAIRTATNKMEGENHYNLSLTGEILNSDRGKILKEIADSYSDRGVTLLDELGDGSYSQFSIHLNADAEDAYTTISDFMNDVRQKAIELDNEDLFADILEISSNSLNQSKSIIDEYGEIYRKALLSEIAVDSDLSTGYNQITKAVEDYNEAILKSEDPYNDDNVKNAWNNLQTVKKGIEENTDEWSKYESVTSEAFKQANDSAYSFYQSMQNDDSISKLTNDLKGLSDTDLKSMADDDVQDSFDKLCQSASDYGLEIQDVIDLLVKLGIVQGQIVDDFSNPDETTSLLGVSETVNALNTKLKPAIDSITDAYQNIFTEDGFTRENINLEMFESLRSEIENMQGELGLDIDYSSFDNFVTVLNDTTSSTQDIQDAFDEVAFSIAEAALEGIEDFSVLKETLKDLGYVNYEMTAFEALLNNKEALLNTGLDLANATDAEITAFVNETISAENASQAIAILTYAKQLNAVENMNTSGEVANLKTLAENAGVAVDVIQHLTELEQIYQMVASGKYMPEQIQGMLNRAKELKGLIEESAKNISFAPKPNQTDWKPMIKSAKKAGKDAGEAYKDAVEQELNDLDSVINAVGDLISDHIDHLQDQCDAAVDALERERDAIIDSLEHEKKALEDAIKTKQDQIDAIREAREERSAELDLQKKEYELERLQNQRTRLVYSDSKGFHYEQDTSEIRDAKEAVDEAKENIKILQIEKEISVLEDSIDNIDDKIEEVNDHYDDLIAQTEQYWQSLIDGLENYKSRWEELGELKEQAEFKRQLEELGLSSVDILNMSEEAFQAFKTQYVDALDKYLQATGDGLSAVADTDLTSTADSVSKVADATTKIDDEKVANLSSAMEGLGDASNLDALYNAFDQLKTIITEISNTLNGVEDGNGLVKALSDLGTLSLGTTGEEATGLIGQFVALKEAIDAVTTAIGGGTDTGTNLTDRGFPSSTGVSKTSGSDGTSSGLKNALKEQVKEATTLLPDEIAKFAGKEDSLESAVQKVITKVAGASGEESSKEGKEQQSESGEADPTNLKGAIQAQYEKAEEVIVPLEVPMFEQLRDVILECVDGLNNMVTAMQSLSEMSLGGDMQFGLINFHSQGTVGKAFARGTGKYNGLSHSEKNALRSEYGQPELTVYPDGTTELTTEPTMSDLPKDTIIFNEEQTRRIMNNKGSVIGNAYSDGTTPIINSPTNLPPYLRELREGDRMYDLIQKMNAHNELIQNQIIPPVNSIQKNAEIMARNISNVNNNNQRSIEINMGDIVCKGVTAQEVAGEIGSALKRELGGMYQSATQMVHTTR